MIVFLDTNIVIYAVENPLIYGPKATAHLTALQASGESFMISDLIRMECLVGPFKSGDRALKQQFHSFFSAASMQVVPIIAAVCDRAASIRATNAFRPMDALHLAAAVEHGAEVFLTNDTRLNSFTGLTVDDLK